MMSFFLNFYDILVFPRRPGTSKNSDFHCTVVIFQGFAFFVLGPPWDRFEEGLGLNLELLLRFGIDLGLLQRTLCPHISYSNPRAPSLRPAEHHNVDVHGSWNDPSLPWR